MTLSLGPSICLGYSLEIKKKKNEWLIPPRDIVRQLAAIREVVLRMATIGQIVLRSPILMAGKIRTDGETTSFSVDPGDTVG